MNRKDNPTAFWSVIGILAGIGLIGIGIAVQIKRQISLLEDYCYKIKPKSFNLKNLTKAGIDFSLILLVKNQSKINASINGYSFEVFINEIPATTIFSDNETPFLAESVNEVPINVNIDFVKNKKLNIGQVLQLLKYYITDKSKIKIKIVRNILTK